MTDANGHPISNNIVYDTKNENRLVANVSYNKIYPAADLKLYATDRSTKQRVLQKVSKSKAISTNGQYSMYLFINE